MMPNNYFPSLVNSRELGGIVLPDGSRVKNDLIFRTSFLGPASKEDLKSFTRLGIKYIFDFRCDIEREMSPERKVKGATNIPISIMNVAGNIYGEVLTGKKSDLTLDERIVKFFCSDESKILFEDFYSAFITDPFCQEGYTQFFRTIIDGGCPPILFHCSQGKDRTGLAAAFLLFAFGADRKTVMDDFRLSYDYYIPMMDKYNDLVIEAGGGEKEAELVEGLFGVSTKWFEMGIDTLYNVFDGPINYLKNYLKLSDKDIDTLRKAYVE